jgi:hypothetical protein
MDPETTCPICSQSDRVARASALYIAGLEQKYGRRLQPKPGEGNLEKPASPVPDFSTWEQIPAGGLVVLAAQLAPPQTSKKVPTRPIHPDMMLLAFGLVSPIFIFGILSNQPGMLVFVLPFLIGLVVFYLWQRKKLVAKHENIVASQRAENERTQRAIERWLWLRYCARDHVVFLPGKEALPPEQINKLLFE